MMEIDLKLTPKLIVLSGLPGSGKSTAARTISSQSNIPVFAKDELEATLIRSELVVYQNNRLGYAGYDLLTECARIQLKAKKSVALDSVCGRNRIRDMWRSLAMEHGARFVVIECICSNETLHRTRLESRQRLIPGWPELEWSEVLRVKATYDEWREERLIIDSCDSMSSNEIKLVQFLRD